VDAVAPAALSGYTCVLCYVITLYVHAANIRRHRLINDDEDDNDDDDDSNNSVVGCNKTLSVQ